MFYQYNSIFKKTYLSSDPETTLDWSQDFDLSETISGIIFFLATEFDLGLSLKLKNGLSLRFLRLRPLPATGPWCSLCVLFRCLPGSNGPLERQGM